ncbi:fungal-specific transcription factor domain-containing protein [Phascolomyces articulosus]|uniref:Fungal-specific transcription factor domain-containing protein n=1 Tax=Phascolomyces articulosus TaxID=60185 RepID=A0AAD5JV62_9FUNG|nr:fungal-specific transcription factor domain-containing protein [Phascolomyces articulosus]
MPFHTRSTLFQLCGIRSRLRIYGRNNYSARKRGPPKGRAEHLEKRIQELHDSICNITGRIDIDTLLQDMDKKEQEQSIGRKKRKRHGDETTKPDRQSVLSREFTENIDALHSRMWPSGARYNDIIYLGDMDSFQLFSKKLRLNKDDKWKGHFIRKYGDTVVLVADDIGPQPQDSKIPKFKWKWNTFAPSLRGIHQYIYLITGLDQYTSTRLLRIYFANIHPILPVIDKREFLEQYRDKCATYPGGDLINAMFGAAARFVETESLDPERKQRIPLDAQWDLPIGWSDHFFDQAQKIISDGLLGPATISTIQAIVLIQNQRATIDTKSSTCWLTGGFGVRLAQGLGLNRNCDDWDISDQDKEARKRTWWALFICDRFQGALNGRPLAIDDDDNDVGYPSAQADWKEVLDLPDDSDEEYDGPRFPSSNYRPETTIGQVCVYQLFVELAKLSEILGRIIRGLYTPEAKMMSVQQRRDETVRKLDRDLTEWRFAFGWSIKHTDFHEYKENGQFSGVVATTILFYFTTLILLHRPFIKSNVVSHAVGTKQTSFSSFWICTSAATHGIRIAASLSMGDYMLTPYAFSLYPVLQCCLILMYNTKNQDPHISVAAKEDLEKGIALIDRIHECSSTAQTLKVLFHSIMDKKNIDTITGPLEMDYQDLDESKRGENQFGKPIKRHLKSRHNQNTNKISISSLIDTFLLQQDISVDSWISRASTPVSMIPLQPTQEEAFTLLQFGLGLGVHQKHNPEATVSPTGLPMATGVLSSPPLIPASTSTRENEIFVSQSSTTINLTSTEQVLPATATTTTNSIPANVASTEMFRTTAPVVSAISNSIANGQPLVDQTLALESNVNVFQSAPDNPFWSIPSSINWTEWHEWYQHTQDSSAWDNFNGQ